MQDAEDSDNSLIKYKTIPGDETTSYYNEDRMPEIRYYRLIIKLPSKYSTRKTGYMWGAAMA